MWRLFRKNKPEDTSKREEQTFCEVSGFPLDFARETGRIRQEIKIRDLERRLDKAVCLLDEIYDWTHHKESRWAVSVKSFLDEEYEQGHP